jgi:membrane protein involved in colicin uptake
VALTWARGRGCAGNGIGDDAEQAVDLLLKRNEKIAADKAAAEELAEKAAAAKKAADVKAEAEKAAKLHFNCTGAPKMGTQWMPCSQHGGAQGSSHSH